MKEKLLEAIELANNGEWDRAHRIVQDIEHELAYWIHANLHREEGDVSNSRYWYRRAKRDYTEMDLGGERELIKKEIEDN
ncbi:MAG: hypothetical protein GWO07_02295 [Candidatus Dadabacteria bacterium]|nr:hypothetical protein [Candidatus Dadabacteria bacterium]NIS07598.1 hypothetical protein [Candidatus Dadabacteria bacterium]NIY21232.1 hypothetical protein [Candidatus Dadabacteria bacterium]